MNKQQRQNIINRGVEIAVERGANRQQVTTLLSQDTFLMDAWLNYGDYTIWTANEVADYIALSIHNTTSTDDGQADYVRMGSLGSLYATQREA